MFQVAVRLTEASDLAFWRILEHSLFQNHKNIGEGVGTVAKRRAWRLARAWSSKMTSVYLELGATEPNANVCLWSQLLVNSVTAALIILAWMIRIECPHVSQTSFWNLFHIGPVPTLFCFFKIKVALRNDLIFPFSPWGKSKKQEKGKGQSLWWERY